MSRFAKADVEHATRPRAAGITNHPMQNAPSGDAVIQVRSRCSCILLRGVVLTMLGTLGALSADHPAPAGDLDPPTPAAFLPGGMLGVQLGGSWEASKLSPSLEHLGCQL